MSTKQPNTEAGAVDEDAVVDELYGLSPDEFTTARDTYAAQARKTGDRAASGRIGKLRRPVLAAWPANLLVREHREEIDAFLELGPAMRRAQEHLEGRELRELSRQRHRMIDALQRRAQALAAARGHPAIGEATLRELQDTLAAALADPDAARALAAGAPTGTLHPTGGFGSPTTPATPEGAHPRKSTDATDAKDNKRRSHRKKEDKVGKPRVTSTGACRASAPRSSRRFTWYGYFR
ncbi:hypothetical protein [Embleya sp. NBC_00896]|uniref:hypothetical protein n=1 Tax=Embleya sp. NBC_00896 TaxID=2975961 RepID=UPI002F90EECB|nr:hypothetical protein OG928_43825 [Embleya sp. NBC_00896]